MDDLISRQAAIASAISGRIRTLPTTEDGEDWIRVSEVRESLKAVPSAQKIGEWIEREDPFGFFDTIPVCSECGHTTKMRERYNYCPNCGARMERE